MGARSNTVFVDDGRQLVNVYRQMGGYIDGHGLELAEFLNGLSMTNGLTGSDDVANGVPCLAAQFIASFKTGPGSIYIDGPITNLHNGYTYVVSGGLEGMDAKPLTVDIFEFDTHIFSGTVEQFVSFCEGSDNAGELSSDGEEYFSSLVS